MCTGMRNEYETVAYRMARKGHVGDMADATLRGYWIYIGSATNATVRKKLHLKRLRNGRATVVCRMNNGPVRWGKW